MSDQILQGFIEDFKGEFDYEEINEDAVFEYFVNYCVISKKYPREFEIDDLSTGGGNDIGFDGVAFVINGNIITSAEEIDYLIERNGSLDVSIILIQSKNSAKFKGDQVGTLIFGIKSFFNETPAIPENEFISNFRDIKDKVYSKSVYFNDIPTLEIYFVTRGNWRDPAQIRGRVDLELKEVKNKNLFSAINFEFYDADKLKNSYRELKRKTVKEVNFSKHVALPEINGVRQSFVGSITAKEYISLISDSEGRLQKSLFYDNVRDYQGNTSVNNEINATINNPSKQAALCILNNGITIIAKKVEPIGEKIKLTDFQVVNGCQSSHVIFENKSILNDETSIVIKIIETTDYELSASIIKSTNRQTEVKVEAFESLSPFHRDLEEFYRAKSKVVNNPIYYERRSKQYEGSPSIKKWQVITLAAQIRSFTASRLSQPQSTHRYYGELLESNRSKMFVSGDKLEIYYLSSLLNSRIEHAFKRETIAGFFKKFRYHILYLVFQMAEKEMRKQKASYNDLISIMDDTNNVVPLINDATRMISKALQDSHLNPQEAMRSRVFTKMISI